ncbi:MAG: Bax inhibitor-1/YccA family protein [Spirochaetota bacterium]
MTDAYRAERGAGSEARVQQFVQQVYGWMAAALALTGFVALAVSRSAAMQRFIFGTPFVFFGLIIGELLLVMWLATRIGRMSASTATTVFVGYSVLNGLTLSSIFLVYAEATIAQTFFVTAGVFGVMTLYGFFTKTDLTRMGNILGMALLGFIIASLVNLFLRSEGLYWLITYAGVAIFTGLVAYDSQRIKEMALAGAGEGEQGQKYAIMGALRLYLDFVNLFLLLLRIFGRRR